MDYEIIFKDMNKQTCLPFYLQHVHRLGAFDQKDGFYYTQFDEKYKKPIHVKRLHVAVELPEHQLLLKEAAIKIGKIVKNEGYQFKLNLSEN